ncbi:hypothetical protein ACFPN7_13495 [Amycolatopsis halotolerans]|uniref:hypothetical protein n=1 Tax=Amycolatopsis halotolerans TaxID=330083 RepID=UPI00361221F9
MPRPHCETGSREPWCFLTASRRLEQARCRSSASEPILWSEYRSRRLAGLIETSANEGPQLKAPPRRSHAWASPSVADLATCLPLQLRSAAIKL